MWEIIGLLIFFVGIPIGTGFLIHRQSKDRDAE